MRTLDLDEFWPQASRSLDGVEASAPPQPAEDTSASAPEREEPIRQPVVPLHRSPVLWGGLGFVAGMLAWHIVGFWSFISHVVYSDGPSQQIVTGSIDKAKQNKVPAPGNLAVKADPSRCIVLELDRAGAGEAKPAACTESLEPLKDAGHRRRSDRAFVQPRMQDPNIWASATSTAEAETTASSKTELDTSDFDLSIKVD